MVGPPDMPESASTPSSAVRLAGFELIRRIGAGGMGLVWEAWQLSPRRRVALKLLHPGLVRAEHRRRFAREAEALGRLGHPGIAQVYESGIAELDGGEQPYIAMELVQGEPLDEWAERHAPSDEERLALLALVCEAVQHAHDNGVIHRDLKPANILVDRDGRPRVLDFGVARLTDADLELTSRQTSAGEVLGTLSYMSPEQVRADGPDGERIEARSDVFALGVLGYRLLCGAPPWELEQLALHEAARVIVEEEPTSLAERDARWRGDVDVMVGTAMAKEPARRYASAAAFAADIRRHLAGEPIQARALGTLARLRKLARRNRALVMGAATVFLALFVSTAASSASLLHYRSEARTNERLTSGYREAAAANEELAREYRLEAETANRMVAFLIEVFESSDPLEPRELSARDLVDNAAARIEGELDVAPEVRGRLLSLLGKAYLEMGMPIEAQPILSEALELRRATHGEHSLEYADALERVSEVARRSSQLSRAEEGQRAVLAIRLEHLGPSHEQVAAAWNNLGNTLADMGRSAEALQAYRTSIEIDEELGLRDATWLLHRSNFARQLFNEGDYEASEALTRELIELSGDDPGFRATLMADLGSCLETQRRYEEAEAWLRDAGTLAESTHGRRSWNYRSARHTLANLLSDTGRADEAEAILRELLATAEEQFGPQSLMATTLLHDLAYCLHEGPEVAETERLYLLALQRVREASERSPMLQAMIEHNLGVFYSQHGQPAKAEPFARSAYEARLAELGPEHPITQVSRGSLDTIHTQLEGR